MWKKSMIDEIYDYLEENGFIMSPYREKDHIELNILYNGNLLGVHLLKFKNQKEMEDFLYLLYEIVKMYKEKNKSPSISA